MHELRGVERPGQRDRHRDEQCVERPLQSPEEQWGERELRLEIVGAAGRLPNVIRAVVAFVPELAEERPQAHFGMRALDVPTDEPPGCVAGDQPVRPRSEGDRGRWTAIGVELEQRVSGGRIRVAEIPHRVAGPKALVPPGGGEHRDGRGMGRQRVDADGLDLAVGSAQQLPGSDAAGLVPHHQRAVTEHEAEHGDLGAGAAGDWLRRRELEVVPVQLGAHELTFGSADEEVVATPVDRHRRHATLRREVQRAARLFALGLAEQRGFFLAAHDDELRRTDRGRGHRAVLARGVREDLDRAAAGIDRQRLEGLHVAIHAAHGTPSPVMECDLDRQHASVRESESERSSAGRRHRGHLRGSDLRHLCVADDRGARQGYEMHAILGHHGGRRPVFVRLDGKHASIERRVHRRAGVSRRGPEQWIHLADDHQQDCQNRPDDDHAAQSHDLAGGTIEEHAAGESGRENVQRWSHSPWLHRRDRFRRRGHVVWFSPPSSRRSRGRRAAAGSSRPSELPPVLPWRAPSS